MSFDPVSVIKTREEMTRILDSVYTTRKLRPSLKALPVIASVGIETLPSLVRSDDRLDKYTLGVKRLEDNLYRLLIEKKMREGQSITGSALVDVRDETWVFFTTGSTYFVHHGIENLLNMLYPLISRIYLNHYDMAQLLNTIKQGYGGSRVITEFIAHVEERSRNRVEQSSVRIAGASAERNLRRYERQSRIWLDKVAFSIVGLDGGTLSESVIYSSGVSRLVYGQFSAFYRNVVGRVIETSEAIDEKYGMVKRDTAEEIPILRPCMVSYQTLFDQSDVTSLLKGLSKEYTISVMHGGNPYLAAELLDVDDGSSFGLTLSEKIVTITPMLRSTRPALWRITTDVQSILGEGVVSVP